MKTGPLSSRRGILALEAVIALVIVATVGVFSSQVLLQTRRSSVNSMRGVRGAQLMSMVVAQLDAAARENYNSLSTYNVARATPATFFSKMDDMGYKDTWITTNAVYSSDQRTCDISVQVDWIEGNNTRKITLTKRYSELTAIHSGAPLQVYVKVPCNSYTDASDIIANCPGAAGIAISAPTGNGGAGNTTAATTDATGLANLRFVQTADNVQVVATSQLSRWDDPSRQGYYVDRGANQYGNSVTKTMQVLNGPNNSLLITDFRPLGRITGSLLNMQTPLVGENGVAPVANMEVGFCGMYVWDGSAFTTVACNYDNLANASPINHRAVFSDTLGQFSVNNIVPVDQAGQRLYVLGTGGYAESGMEITDPRFRAGYGNLNNQLGLTLWSTVSSALTASTMINSINVNGSVSPGTSPSAATAPTPIINLSGVEISRYGHLRFRAVDTNGVAVPNAVLWADSPATPYRYSSWWRGTSNANGEYLFANRWAIPSSVAVWDPGLTAYSLTAGAEGMGGRLTPQPREMNVVNMGTIVMQPGAPVVGVVADSLDPTRTLDSVTVKLALPDYSNTITATVDGTNSFELHKFLPALYNLSSVPFNFSAPASNIQVPVLSGRVIDKITGQVYTGIPIQFNNGTVNSATTDDYYGSYSIATSFSYAQTVPAAVTFDAVTGKYRVTSPPIRLDTSEAAVTAGVYDGSLSNGAKILTGTATRTVSHNATITNFDVPVVLGYYTLSGTLTDAVRHQPVAGIRVRSADSAIANAISQAKAVTDAAGHFQVVTPVVGRTATNPGTVALTIDSGQGDASGVMYGGVVGPAVPVPTPATPHTPLTYDLTIDPNGCVGCI